MTPRRGLRRVAAALVVALLVGGGLARAEDRPKSLRGRLFAAAADRLIASDAATQRMRGYERLAASGSMQGVARLLKALDNGGEARTAKERVVIVRALAPRTDDPAVRRVLVRIMTEGLAERAGPSEEALDALLRGTAAMSLARSGAPDALRALSGALRTVGPAATAAETAFVAHPPKDLAAIVQHRGPPSEAEVRVLEAIGDQRAFEPLRALVRSGAPRVAALAAIALARLGDFEVVPLARRWQRERGDRKWAAARILAAAGAPGSDELIAELLSSPEDRAEALELALDGGRGGVVPALSRHWSEGGRFAPEVAAALGRIHSRGAARVLEAHLAGRDAPFAFYALARMPIPEASRALATALGRAGPGRRLALRAAAVRAHVLGEKLAGADAVAESLLRSELAVDRAAATSWIGAVHPERLAALVKSGDEPVVLASLRWLGGSRDAAEAALAELLAAKTPSRFTSALALPDLRSRVPTDVLLRCIEAGGAGAPIAALALAERDDASVEEDVRALLASPAALVRAQAALGLGRRPSGQALAWLEDAYRFETDATVRAAIVTAVARRSEGPRTRLLMLAASLDPDPAVRVRAELAGRGVRLDADPNPRQTLWVVVDATELAPRGLVVRLPSGEAVPMAPDPDGVVVAGWLPDGPLDVRVAFAPEGDHAGVRGSP